ncbi:MAG TPA: DPP IV N-terminal domain-containing protein [Edaphocola sp.]|nr:DPP IV N-terminal domain-containing protein [Edaphocola sp.]
MKKIILLGLLLIQVGALSAQKKQFTMQDAVLGLRTNLAVENISAPVWSKEKQTLFYQKKNVLYKAEAPQFESNAWISLAGFNEKMFGKDSLKAIPFINFNNENPYFRIKNHLYFVKELQTNGISYETPILLPENAANLKVSKKLIAFTQENNLMAIDEKGQKHTITNNGENSHIISGQSVHRNEFGINGGIFIAPDNNKIAFYRMDESMVSDYPIISWQPVPAQNNNIKYPMAGSTSHQVTLGVYDLNTKKTIFLQTGAPLDQYLTCVTWSPDNKYIFIAVLNRDQNFLKLNRYDATTGTFINTLFEEHSEKYVEPQHELVFLPKSNTEFVWMSQRSGFMHLYLYNTSGKLLKQLTSGGWLVNEIEGINASANELIITTTKDSPKEKHVYSLNYKTKAMKKLDNASGIHNVSISKDGKYILDSYANSTTPRVTNIINNKGTVIKNIINADDPLKDYERSKVQEVTLAAEDGTPLFGKLIYPSQFDPNKKYPVIVYLYNGPHVQLITNNYPASGNLWYELLAQKGYIVFTMDGRGSGNRGLAFEQAVFRHLGTKEMNDQLKGVEYLKSLPFVDKDRMGVHGWSFGGFMTTSLMLRHPDVFKVGVAGGPVIDWTMYEIMYTERYMDAPQNNPKGYAESNLLTKTKNLKGKLLMIHGAQDDVVVWQHSIRFVKACVDNGVQMDYFVYPGHPHNVMGKDRVHLMQKITDYFDEYLMK